MVNYFRHGLIWSTVLLVGLTSTAILPTRRAWGEDSSAQSSRSSTDTSAYLDGRSKWWRTWHGSARGQGTACVSCHTRLPIALAQAALRQLSKSRTVDPEQQALVDNVYNRVSGWNAIVSSSDWSQCVAYYTDQKPAALGTESILNALVLVNHDVKRSDGNLSPGTETALSYLWQQE